MSFQGAYARDSVSSLMPMSWGARGGYTATFEHAVLESVSRMGFDGKPTGAVTTYTANSARQLELPPADQYAAMIDHVLAVLCREVENQISPVSTLDALTLTLEIDQQVNGKRKLTTEGPAAEPRRIP